MDHKMNCVTARYWTWN